MLNRFVLLDLTPDDLEVLESKKAIAVAQAEVVCLIYKAGQLREMLDRLRIDNGQYISYSNHSQQNGDDR